MELLLYVCDNAVIKHLIHALRCHRCSEMMMMLLMWAVGTYLIEVLICLSQQYHTGRKATS